MLTADGAEATAGGSEMSTAHGAETTTRGSAWYNKHNSRKLCVGYRTASLSCTLTFKLVHRICDRGTARKWL